MEVIRTMAALRERMTREKSAGNKIGFVPTMGFLHEGHVALMRAARRQTDFVVVSIFVNPTQFGPQEDFSRYPRDLEGDLEKLKGEADLVFYPSAQEIYPPGFQSVVQVGKVADGLCGAFRPGHFQGVATVVAKFFHLVSPDYAFFGEKDYQQLQVIRRMVRDLNFPIQVVGVATVRDRDGLALSSRNSYLSAAEREAALLLPRTLEKMRKKAAAGVYPAKAIASEALELLRQEPRVRVEYVEVVHPEDLTPIAEVGAGKPGVLAVALYVSKVRLIDNCFLGREP